MILAICTAKASLQITQMLHVRAFFIQDALDFSGYFWYFVCSQSWTTAFPDPGCLTLNYTQSTFGLVAMFTRAIWHVGMYSRVTSLFSFFRVELKRSSIFGLSGKYKLFALIYGTRM